MTPTVEPAAVGFVILVPMTAAALAFVVPTIGRWLGLASSAAIGGAVFALARHVHDLGTLRHAVGGWSAPLGISLRADGPAVLLLAVVAVVGSAVTLYAQRYFDPDHGGADSRRQQHYFWPLWLFLWAALNALCLAADVFNLYVTLELLSFAAVALVALAGGRTALTAAMRYLLVSLSGSLFYLLGVALIYGATSTVDLALLAERVRPDMASWSAMALMTTGLLMKAGLFPMHFWLPPAHASAPGPVSALLSALVVKAAFFILLRLWLEAFRALVTPGAALVLGALGAAAIVWGSLQALRQVRLKLLVAYSTVAQLGYLFLVFPLAAAAGPAFDAWAGALLFLAAHACAKAAMFLTAGNILRAAGHDRIRDLDGITHQLPVSVFAFALSGISLAGLPPTSGFVGKWMLIGAGLTRGMWGIVAVVLIGSLLAAAYVMRVLTHAFTRVSEPTVPSPVPRLMEWTAFALALFAVLLGLLASWPLALLRASALAGGVAP